jgi:hypothetical protein
LEVLFRTATEPPTPPAVEVMPTADELFPGVPLVFSFAPFVPPAPITMG